MRPSLVYIPNPFIAQILFPFHENNQISVRRKTQTSIIPPTNVKIKIYAEDMAYFSHQLFVLIDLIIICLLSHVSHILTIHDPWEVCFHIRHILIHQPGQTRHQTVYDASGGKISFWFSHVYSLQGCQTKYGKDQIQCQCHQTNVLKVDLYIVNCIAPWDKFIKKSRRNRYF